MESVSQLRRMGKTRSGSARGRAPPLPAQGAFRGLAAPPPTHGSRIGGLTGPRLPCAPAGWSWSVPAPLPPSPRSGRPSATRGRVLLPDQGRGPAACPGRRSDCVPLRRWGVLGWPGAPPWMPPRWASAAASSRGAARSPTRGAGREHGCVAWGVWRFPHRARARLGWPPLVRTAALFGRPSAWAGTRSGGAMPGAPFGRRRGPAAPASRRVCPNQAGGGVAVDPRFWAGSGRGPPPCWPAGRKAGPSRGCG